MEKDRGKRSIKANKRKWIENITNTAEEAAIIQRMRTLYRLTKMIYNERPKHSVVLDKNGKLVSGKDEVQARWTEYFKEIFLTGKS